MVLSWSSKNRDPAFGPRFTTSNAELCGSASAPKSRPSALAVAAASCSLVKSARNAEVLSPGDVFRPLVLVVIGQPLLPSRLLLAAARSVSPMACALRCARLEGEDRGNGFGLVAGDIRERPHGAVGQVCAEPVGGTGWVGMGQDL